MWDDRARMGAAVISELEGIQLVSVNLRMGRMSSIGHSRRAVVVVLRRVIGRVLRQVGSERWRRS